MLSKNDFKRIKEKFEELTELYKNLSHTRPVVKLNLITEIEAKNKKYLGSFLDFLGLSIQGFSFFTEGVQIIFKIIDQFVCENEKRLKEAQYFTLDFKIIDDSDVDDVYHGVHFDRHTFVVNFFE